MFLRILNTQIYRRIASSAASLAISRAVKKRRLAKGERHLLANGTDTSPSLRGRREAGCDCSDIWFKGGVDRRPLNPVSPCWHLFIPSRSISVPPGLETVPLLCLSFCSLLFNLYIILLFTVNCSQIFSVSFPAVSYAGCSTNNREPGGGWRVLIAAEVISGSF